MLSRIYMMLFVVSVAAIVSCPNLVSAQEKANAQRASEEWLTLIDAGKYAEGYEETAQIFKQSATKEQLQGSLHAAREPLGVVISRKLQSATPTKVLPGAPDGNYVVVLYNTSFQHKTSAIETVTTIFDSYGFWRVCGYYIK